MATTKFFAPSDFLPGATLSLRRGFLMKRSWDEMVAVFRKSNLGLFWHRYLPAHNFHEENETSWGADFSSDYELAKQRAHEDVRLNRRRGSTEERERIESNNVRQLSKQWKGFGALCAFSDVGNEVIIASEHFVKELHNRRERLLQTLGSRSLCFEVTTLTRATPGVGYPSSFENSGIVFDHTYGFPILPGSSLKGLLRHYLEEEVSLDDSPDAEIQRLAQGLSAGKGWNFLIEMLLGTSKRDTEKDEGALQIEANQGLEGDEESDEAGGSEGALVFYDAWPLADRNWFDVDVLTVHHQDYYAGKSSAPVANDMEGTVPAHFLTLAIGVTFRVPLGISVYGRTLLAPEQQEVALKLAERALGFALFYWGIGARTGAGFGRALIHPTS